MRATAVAALLLLAACSPCPRDTYADGPICRPYQLHLPPCAWTTTDDAGVPFCHYGEPPDPSTIDFPDAGSDAGQ